MTGGADRRQRWGARVMAEASTLFNKIWQAHVVDQQPQPRVPFGHAIQD